MNNYQMRQNRRRYIIQSYAAVHIVFGRFDPSSDDADIQDFPAAAFDPLVRISAPLIFHLIQITTQIPRYQPRAYSDETLITDPMMRYIRV